MYELKLIKAILNLDKTLSNLNVIQDLPAAFTCIPPTENYELNSECPS